MKKISSELDIRVPNSIDDIYKIHFHFSNGEYKNQRICQNIIGWDTESSNGFRIPNSDKVIGFDQEKYDRGIDKTHNIPRHKIDHNDEDVKYMELIDECEPVGLMYMWQCAIEDGMGGIMTFIGRTWQEYYDFQIKLTQEIKRQNVFGFKSINREQENDVIEKERMNITLSIFTHNLGHDWQFLRSLYNDSFVGRNGHNVFARKPRKPMKASMRLNGVTIIYKDTLSLSQKSLRAWAKDCPNCPLEKLDDFDYLTIKTPLDELTPEEIHYGINDVVIIVYCVEYERMAYGSIENIPLTQTGKVRKVCYEQVCKKNAYWTYNCAYISKHYSPEEYRKRIALYQGGYTHACNLHIGDVTEARCFDFASSYPSSLCTGLYAIEGYEECDISEFADLECQDVENPKFRWFAQIKLNNVQSVLAHTYWSSSKCKDLENPTIDNGRVFACKSMTIWVMDLDWYTFKQAYSWTDMEVLDLEKGRADYLPKEMINTVLDYYSKKCLLKGEEDRISEYIESKEFINSIYGSFVYKQISDQVSFDTNGWETRRVDDEGDQMFYELLMDISEDKAFGFFDLGMTCSAISRKRIWDFILHFDSKVWYVDTDSIKGTFDDDDLKWIEDYNKWIEDRENKIAKELNFDPMRFCPVTSKGKHKRLGIMEREDDCKFKTLGAKRYIAEHDGEIECTIAGLPKACGKAKIKTFDDFNNGTLWNTKESGKVCCYYNDNQPKTVWIGRDGQEYVSEDKYGVCLKPVTFDLTMSGEFVAFLTALANGTLRTGDEMQDITPTYLLR